MTVRYTPRTPEVQRVIVLGCVKTKSSAPGELPAAQRYTSALWRGRLAYANAQPDAHTVVLSALHGLIDLDTPITSYNRTLTNHEQVRLMEPYVIKQVDAWWRHARSMGPTFKYSFEVHAGAFYDRLIRRVAMHHGWPVADSPVAGLQVGELLRFYKAYR